MTTRTKRTLVGGTLAGSLLAGGLALVARPASADRHHWRHGGTVVVRPVGTIRGLYLTGPVVGYGGAYYGGVRRYYYDRYDDCYPRYYRHHHHDDDDDDD